MSFETDSNNFSLSHPVISTAASICESKPFTGRVRPRYIYFNFPLECVDVPRSILTIDCQHQMTKSKIEIRAASGSRPKST